MRFLADMGISPATVAWLRKRGYEADHLLERGEQQAEDADILGWARKEDRILLVHDLDFSDLVAASQGTLPSVVVFRLRDMRPGNVNQHLHTIIENHRTVLKEGAIFSVREGRIRWRPIPFDTDE